MRDPTGPSDEERAYGQRLPDYTRQALSDLFLKYHTKVAKPPKLNRDSRRFECGMGTVVCGQGWKTVDELKRHYLDAHA